MNITKSLAILVLILGLIGIVLGGVFVSQGLAKNSELKEAMRVEHVTLGIEGIEDKGQVIDSLEEAQKACDTIREHRRGIAPTYSDLLGEGRFDPTDPIGDDQCA